VESWGKIEKVGSREGKMGKFEKLGKAKEKQKDFPNFLGKVGACWGKTGKGGASWGRLGKGWGKLGKVRGSWAKLEKAEEKKYGTGEASLEKLRKV